MKLMMVGAGVEKTGEEPGGEEKREKKGSAYRSAHHSHSHPHHHLLANTSQSTHRKVFFGSNCFLSVGNRSAPFSGTASGALVASFLAATSQGCSRAWCAVRRVEGSTVRQRRMKSRAVGLSLASSATVLGDGERTRESGGGGRERRKKGSKRTSLTNVLPVLHRLKRIVGRADRLDLVHLGIAVEGGVAC